MINVVETKDLTKRYKGNTVVDCLNLVIPAEQIFGLLGPNGAGKTTSILMMLGLTEPSSGSIRVGGFNPVTEPLKVKRIVGYMPEIMGFYDNLTACQNLDLIAEFNGINAAESRLLSNDLLEKVGLKEVKDKAVGTFSKGMKQRLGFADVLIKRPQIVILDEPTTALDPTSINEILDLIRILPESGTTVIFSSHRLYEVQQVCHRVGILSNGKLIVEGNLEDLRQGARAEAQHQIDITTGESAASVEAEIAALDGVKTVRIDGNHISVGADADVRAVIVKTIAKLDIPILEVKTGEINLDDIYLKYFREEEPGVVS